MNFQLPISEPDALQGAAKTSDPAQRGNDFAHRVVTWQLRAGRHDLPWQASANRDGVANPYHVWLSEIMLQQTQVATVVAYFQRFLEHFANVQALAKAEQSEVLAQWSGLGYYARARNLHRAAQQLVHDYGAAFPTTQAAWQALPGVGRSTAAAITSFCFGERAAILDGNVKRVLTRHFGVQGFPGEKKIETQLWQLAESLLPSANEMPAYTQGLMDLGATLCRRSKPLCGECPLRATCVAHRDGLTAQLPSPRPRMATPTRSATLLLPWQNGKVWLQRRPPNGLWGGLLAPLQLDAEDAQDAKIQAFLLRHHWQIGRQYALPSFRHAFTHFTLLAKVRVCEVLKPAPDAENAALGEWVDPYHLHNLPLPTPIRRMLHGLSRSVHCG